MRAMSLYAMTRWTVFVLMVIAIIHFSMVTASKSSCKDKNSKGPKGPDYKDEKPCVDVGEHCERTSECCEGFCSNKECGFEQNPSPNGGHSGLPGMKGDSGRL